MDDEPSRGALLDTARRALTDAVVPALSGHPRYVALMVANALGIVQRELAEAEAQAAARARVLGDHAGDADPAAALARAIRAGERDGDPDLHRALLDAAEIAARILRPEPSAGRPQEARAARA